MKRLLESLPIALLILMAFALPASVHAAGFSFANNGFVSANQITAPTGATICFNPHDDGALPEGLTLTKGSPFVSPSEVKSGDLVTVKIKASNSGVTPINHQLSLQVNGTSVGTPQQISVEPGETKDVSFQFTASQTGANAIVVGTLSGTFNVTDNSFFDIFPPYLWAFFGVVLAVIVLMVVLLLLKPKKKMGSQMEQSKKPLRGKAVKPGKSGSPEATGMGPQAMQRPPGMTGMPEGMLFGQGIPQGGPDMMGTHQFQNQPGMQPPFGQGQLGMQSQQPGMQQPFGPGQGQSGMQPGMQHPFPQQGQPGMQPQQPGMQQPFGPGQGQSGMQPGMQHPFPQQGQPGMQQPQQQGMQIGMQPGVQQPMRGPQFPNQPPQAGIQQPFGPGQGQPGMQPPFAQPGMQPMQAPGQPQMQPPQPFGMPQPVMSGGFQSMGMPKFAVSNLTITPNKVKVGESVNISVIVSNNGLQTGKYSVVLRIGGVVENITDLTLPAGSSQTATFTVIKDAPGDYYADIDGVGGFFTVIPLAPPSFSVSNFSIGPERVRQGQPVTVSAMVTNTGEVTGSHTLILRVKGLAESQQEITLGPGKTQNIDFQIIKDTPGFYPVSLENWTGKFVVEMDWTG